jgi:hypothetical protein
MKKALKIIGIIAGVLIIIVGVISFYGYRKMQNFNLAKEKADYIINNLDNPNIAEKFPVKFFPKEQLDPVLIGIREKCDWKSKDGKFVDFFTQKSVGGIDQNAFIYEYYLKCDSLRFILSFNTEKEPELMNFYFEPLENENKMILFPEKQLKNR